MPEPNNPKPAASPTIASRLVGDLTGGLSAAMLALPQALGMGTLVFLPLGREYLHVGIAAAFYASIAGGLIAAWVSGTRFQISGPRASTSVILASFVAALVANPQFAGRGDDAVSTIITLIVVTVLLGGALQMLFAGLRLGKALKFIPHPVLAGFMYGIAVLIVVKQTAPLLGIPADVPFAEIFSHAGDIKPLAMLVGGITVLAALFLPRLWPASARFLPAPLAGLLAGTVAFVVIRSFSNGAAVGDMLTPISAGAALNFPLQDVLKIDWLALWPRVGQELLTTALLLAIVGSVDTLLTTALVDTAVGCNQDGDRALLAQGVSNVGSAALGGIFVCGTALTVMTNHRAGGRTALSGAIHSLALLAVLFVGGNLIAFIPLAVLAGFMITVALSVFDEWTRDLFQRVRGSIAMNQDMMANLGIVVLVGATTAFVNIVAAVVVGVIAATILLVVRMSLSIVYRVSDGAARSSLKVRETVATGVLRAHGKQIGVVELEGYVFFGTADRMRSEVEALADGRRFVILDFRRVYEVEASGARVLQVLGKTLAERNIRVVLSHVRADETLGLYLQDTGVASAIDCAYWFSDLDRALEWAEDQLLLQHVGESVNSEIALQDAALFAGLSAAELASLHTALEREVLTDGTPVFHEGDPGDRLYVIVKGEVTITLKLPGSQHSHRLSSFGPGLVFGEMALIEGKPRSADAIVKHDTVLYSLKATSLDALRLAHPDIAVKIMANITRQLAARLRTTSEQLRNSY